VKAPIALARVDSTSTSSNSGDLPGDTSYDGGRRMTLRGSVTNVDWINPRVRFNVSVKETGGTTSWTVEIADGATTLRLFGGLATVLELDALVTPTP